MERLTFRQKEVFDELLANKGKISMDKIAKKTNSRISRQAIAFRIKLMVKKGYLYKKDGLYLPTQEGIDRIFKDGGKTKSSYYEKRENWEKTLRPNVFSKEAEERTE